MVTCEGKDCNKKARWTSPGEGSVRVCSDHKDDTMVEMVRKQECQAEGCSVEPAWNFIDVKGRAFCFKHKLDGMVNKKVRKKLP